jgi:hypothetical protein
LLGPFSQTIWTADEVQDCIDSWVHGPEEGACQDPGWYGQPVLGQPENYIHDAHGCAEQGAKANA